MVHSYPFSSVSVPPWWCLILGSRFSTTPTSYIHGNLIQKFNLIWPMKPLYLSFISVTSLEKKYVMYRMKHIHEVLIVLVIFFLLFSSKFGLHSASNFHIPREKWLSWYRKKHIKIQIVPRTEPWLVQFSATI